MNGREFAPGVGSNGCSGSAAEYSENLLGVSETVRASNTVEDSNPSKVKNDDWKLAALDGPVSFTGGEEGR